jgi:hypothetical protein
MARKSITSAEFHVVSGSVHRAVRTIAALWDHQIELGAAEAARAALASPSGVENAIWRSGDGAKHYPYNQNS